MTGPQELPAYSWGESVTWSDGRLYVPLNRNGETVADLELDEDEAQLLADMLTDASGQGRRRTVGAAERCDDTAEGAFGAQFGPCVKRVDHPAAIHRNADGATWTYTPPSPETATLDQLRAYLAATGWERRPAGPPYTDHWHHPAYSDYPDDGMAFHFEPGDPDPVRSWGILEGLASDEGRCEHEVLADVLGQPDTATLLRRIEELASRRGEAAGQA